MSPNSTTRVGWQHFDDWKCETQAEAFEQAALALTSIVTQLESVESRQQINVSVENSDRELLFVDWLDALIFEMATRRMLFSRYVLNPPVPA